MPLSRGEEFDNINHLSNVFREDTVVPSYDREQILSNANDREDGHFLIKKTCALTHLHKGKDWYRWAA